MPKLCNLFLEINVRVCVCVCTSSHLFLWRNADWLNTSPLSALDAPPTSQHTVCDSDLVASAHRPSDISAWNGHFSLVSTWEFELTPTFTKRESHHSLNLLSFLFSDIGMTQNMIWLLHCSSLCDISLGRKVREPVRHLSYSCEASPIFSEVSGTAPHAISNAAGNWRIECYSAHEQQPISEAPQTSVSDFGSDLQGLWRQAGYLIFKP